LRISDGWDQHMERYYDPAQLHASSWARFWFVAGWQARSNPWSPSVKSRCVQFAQTERVSNLFLLGADFRLRLRWKGKERTTMKDDVYDIPMVYLLYVLIAIAGILAAAVILIIRML
jgi:hypothetical protein